MNDDADLRPEPSPFISVGGESQLSNSGQLQLMQAVMARRAHFRTAVRGGSMLPFIRDNDVLTIAPLDGAAPRVGEIVAFIVPRSGKLAIHRVIARTGDAWLIQGDNCLKEDGIVSLGKILGSVSDVERQGRTVHFGLGAEARVIAWLQRVHVLRPAVRTVWWIKKQLRRDRSCSEHPVDDHTSK